MRLFQRLMVLAAALLLCSAFLPSQENKYGGDATGVWIYFPTNSGMPQVSVDKPVAPGGAGTEPDKSGEADGWNLSGSSLAGANSTTSVSSSTKTFAKLQTITIEMPSAPSEKHWEAQGKAVVGGKVSASLLEANGTCHAAAYSKTVVVYGGQTAKAESNEGVALAHAGSTSIGGTVSIAGWGGGFQMTYAAAGNGTSEKALGDQDTKPQDRASKVVIDYTQKGNMAYAFQAVAGGPAATCSLSAEAKGSAVVWFILVNGD